MDDLLRVRCKAGTDIFGISLKDVADILQAECERTGEPATARSADAKREEGGAEQDEKQTRRTRGRPADTDLKADAQIFSAWGSRRYKTYGECARALGLDKREVKAAVDRHRKRIERAAK
ncbi:MAG TPA: hypothetical protein DDY78_11855 [Planctomycetales bacterium]|jgi:hypothetical protein|nr:hypothetical protein [Planctomycetales bacterium]